MATYRTRTNGRVEAIVKHRLLPSPISRTFATKALARAFAEPLQRALEAGILPAGFDDFAPRAAGTARLGTLGDAMRAWQSSVSLRAHEIEMLGILSRSRVGAAALADTRLAEVSRPWVESYVRDLRLARRLTPGSIAKRIGTLRRLFEWLLVHRPAAVAVNPFASLPRGFAGYTSADARQLRAAGRAVPTDVERDRRLDISEEDLLRIALLGTQRPGRERAPVLKDGDDLALLITLALETAMRLRELYTLTVDQIDLDRRTIYLDRTKNGDARQVPLSTVACDAIRQQLARLETVARATPGPRKTVRRGGALLFPALFDGDWAPDALRRTTSRLSRRFGWLTDYAGIADLRFHDLRHEATCRFYERTSLTDVQIARITGHRDLRMLRRYASLRGSELASLLW